MTKTGSRSRTVSDRKHNNISFQRKKNRLLEANQQKFVPNKEQAPRAKRSRTYTPKLFFPKQNWLRETSGPGPQTQTKIFASKQNRLSEPNGTQTSQNKKDQLKLNTCTNNSSKRRQMKNQNYALGTRGTLNTLNKVVAKLAKKPNNPNVGEKT